MNPACVILIQFLELMVNLGCYNALTRSQQVEATVSKAGIHF